MTLATMERPATAPQVTARRGTTKAKAAPTLDALAATANREHELCEKAGASMVEHAIRAGSALNAARESVPSGGWEAWVRRECGLSPAQARRYMQLAVHRDAVLRSGADSINQAVQWLADNNQTQIRRSGVAGHPEWKRDAARKMAQEGTRQVDIARELGVSRPTVCLWVNPEAYRKHRASTARRNRRLRAERAALRERERQQAVKEAVRQAGGALAEAYAMAERMQDVIGQAHREATDTEARVALGRAGEHYRKMRDEIVRALGVEG